MEYMCQETVVTVVLLRQEWAWMAEKRKEEEEEVQKRGEENRSPSLAELCRMQQNTVPPMEDCQVT